MNDNGSVEAFVPRGLVGNGRDVLGAPVTFDGLCFLRISWLRGRITSIEAIEQNHRSQEKLLLPRLLEPHTHIDKAFTWGMNPNLVGTYSAALAANLQEHQTRTANEVRLRAERSITLGLRNGLRAVRSHIDSFGLGVDQIWEVLIDLRRKWKPLIDLQLVAMVPLEYWNTALGNDLAARISHFGGLLGGVLAPPFKEKILRDSLLQMFQLASKFGCGVDLHIDEADTHPGDGLKQLVQVLDQSEINIPITCSHSSSMGLLPPKELKLLANRLAEHHVNVVALPLTNAWLLGRQPMSTPVIRPLAPIFQLQQAGVKVAVGGDNVQDPWFPGGNFDPLALMAFALPIAQLAPWKRLGLAPFTTSASSLMNLEWDGTFIAGAPADFILLEAGSWSEVLSMPTKRRVIIQGRWFDDLKISSLKMN